MMTSRPCASRPALLAMLVTAAWLSGCATPPAYERPGMDVPVAFKESALWQAARIDAAVVPDDWWQLFNDPVLNSLQQELVIGNENLKASVAQYQVARAALASSTAATGPTLGLGAGVTQSVLPSITTPTTSNSLSLNAGWELDLWDRLSGAASVAQARLQASSADLAAARLSAQALLTQSYFSLRSAEAQADLLERSVGAYQRSLQLTQNRYAGGVASAADVAQATTLLRSTQAQLVDATASRALLEHAIATLLGKPAAAFRLPRTAQLPVAPAAPVQLPASLLERRPDIAAAERRVAAANAQLGVAQSAFFPSLNLSASAGYRGPDLANLLNAPNLFWSLGPALALTLFDGGARQAAQDSARASMDQAAAVYRQTVLVALQEVEDNLVSAASLQEQATLQADAHDAAQRNLEITNNQYKAGTVSYLNVVTAQTTALAAERTLLDVRNRRLAATATLLKNLGGRWDVPQAAASATR